MGHRVTVGWGSRAAALPSGCVAGESAFLSLSLSFLFQKVGIN